MNNLIKELSVLSENANVFSDINIQYIIPLYQRAFAWEDKEISQLIEDINDFEEDNYYIGSLIVSRKGIEYEVIDGQQRLTALFLLLRALEVKTLNNLTFACREKSNYTLQNINNLLLDENIETSLQKGKQIINKIIGGHKLNRQEFNKEVFISQLKKVKLYRIEVPQNTDLNRYFEIMNTRGEQLEQHDILKATLMSAITNDEKKSLFANVWDACSDMTGYVQMHFDTDARRELFGQYWDELQKNIFKGKKANSNKNDKNFNIQDIIQDDFKVNNVDGIADNDERIRFESIISFPFFLLHSLKVLVDIKDIQHIKQGETVVYELLDDKKLTETFNRVIKNGIIGDKNISDNKELFSLNFVKCLLKCRFIFDKYIVKREYVNENSDGEWSLKELKVSGQASSKKPYYVNTYFGKYGEWAKTYETRTKTNLMLQSCLRVSYTSPKIMHWITSSLKWLYSDDNLQELNSFEKQTENIAKSAVKCDYFDELQDEAYDWGTDTPHIVFNYLDYLLWKVGKISDKDFVFEFRNSVEHWYPQISSEGTFEQWSHEGGLDDLGNLCIIQSSINSKFSNISPDAKKSTFDKMIAKGSLKLKIMAEMTMASPGKNASQNWRDEVCKEHQNEMVKILMDACNSM